MRILLTLLLGVLLSTTLSNAADITASASRTSGIAPLSVHFNADLDESDGAAETFHDYRYVWDFGDTGSGTWGTDGLSKDVAYGAVTVHVFEDAGTFTVTLTVYDSSDGTVVTGLGESFEIVVTGEDAYYSITATTCISTSGTFTDCPSGANEYTVASGDLGAALHDYLGAGKRLLLRRGESWAVTSAPSLTNGSGPTTLGAYGTCTGEDSMGICTNPPVIAVSNGITFVNGSYKQDWRFQDIKFTNDAKDSYLMQGNTKAQRWLFSRVHTTGFYSVIMMGNYRPNNGSTLYHDQIHVYSSYIDKPYRYPFYAKALRTAITGSVFTGHTATGVGHIIRLPNAYLAVVSHNQLAGANSIKHVIKLNAPADPYVGTYDELIAAGSFLDYYGKTVTALSAARNGQFYTTRFAIISDNLIGMSGVYTIAIAPQNPENDERIYDVLVERNTFLSGYGYREGIAVQGVHVAADYVTIRNNIFDITDSDGTMRALVYTRAGYEPAHTGFRVYNNTIYSKDSGALSRVGIKITQGSDSIARNNLVSFPGSTGVAVKFESGYEPDVDSNNILTDTPGFVDPDNATVTDRDFQLTAASDDAALLNTGHDTPLMDDLDADARTLTEYDIGAYEYDAGGDTSPPTYNSKLPSGILPYGTTSTSVSFNTSETANCRWDTTAAVGATDALKYADLDNAFAQNPGDSFSLTATGLTNGMATRTYYIRCADTVPNYTTSDEEIDIDVEAAAQTTPLSPWDSFPEDYAFENPPGTGEIAVLSFLVDADVDRVGTCRWDLSATATSANQTEAATDYDAMSDAFPQVDQHNAQTNITVVDGTTVTYYARCKDNSLTPIYMLSDYTIEVITLEETACEIDAADCASEANCIAAWPTYSYCSDFTPACRVAPCIAVSSGSFVSGSGTVVSGGGTWWTD